MTGRDKSIANCEEHGPFMVPSTTKPLCPRCIGLGSMTLDDMQRVIDAWPGDVKVAHDKHTAMIQLMHSASALCAAVESGLPPEILQTAIGIAAISLAQFCSIFGVRLESAAKKGMEDVREFYRRQRLGANANIN